MIHANVGFEAVPTWKTPLPPAPEMLKTVMFTVTAVAPAGTPHGAPIKVTKRLVLSSSGVELRESYCRQGASVK